MFRLLLTFLLAATLIVVGYLYKEGLNIENFQLNLGPLSLGIYNLKWKGNLITLKSLALSIKTPKQAVEEPTTIDGEEIKSLTNRVLKIFSILPLRVEIKNVYLFVDGISVNLYRLKISKNNLYSDFVEGFSPEGEAWVKIYRPKVYGNYYTYYGTLLFSTFDYIGFTSLKYIPSKGKLFTEFNVKGLSKGSLTLKLDKVSTYRLEVESNFGNFNLQGNVKGSFLSSSGNFTSPLVEGKLSLTGRVENPKIGVRGIFKVCEKQHSLYRRVEIPLP